MHGDSLLKQKPLPMQWSVRTAAAIGYQGYVSSNSEHPALGRLPPGRQGKHEYALQEKNFFEFVVDDVVVVSSVVVDFAQVVLMVVVVEVGVAGCCDGGWSGGGGGGGGGSGGDEE